MIAHYVDALMANATLSEADSKALLASFGLPIGVEVAATGVDDAVLAADAIGFPVVVKLCGDAIAHKTERGLVRLNLGDGAAVRGAASDLLQLATEADGAVSLLVARMVHGQRELIAGVARDAQFGAVVMLGVGGVLAEAVADVVFRLVPVDRADGAEMIEDLASQRLLGPWRGEPAVERERLIDVIVALSDVIVARPDVMAIDVNPVIISNGVPVAVDALVEVVVQ